MRLLLGLFCMVLVGIRSCDSSKYSIKLNEGKWVLETLNGERVKLNDPERKMFIQFDETEQRVNGRAACNRFFGHYEIDGNKLKFSPMGATRMHCPDLSVETEFFQMLEKVDACIVEEDMLLFESKGNVVATFRKGKETKE